MRLVTLAAALILTVFAGNLVVASVTGQGLGVTVTKYEPPSDPVAPDLPASDPAAPVVSGEEESGLSSYVMSGDAGTTTRQFGGGLVKVTMQQSGSTLKYLVETSYGCSLLAGGSTHGYGEMKVCMVTDVLPPAPSGFSREKFWYLLEDDAFWEAKYAVLAAAQVNVRADPRATDNAWMQVFSKRALERGEYLAWVHSNYADHYTSDFRGVSYTEASVQASCGGAYLPWIAPFGCAVVNVQFTTRLSLIGFSGYPSNRAILDSATSQTDPLGITGDKWLLPGKVPPPDGHRCWIYPEGFGGVAYGSDAPSDASATGVYRSWCPDPSGSYLMGNTMSLKASEDSASASLSGPRNINGIPAIGYFWDERQLRACWNTENEVQQMNDATWTKVEAVRSSLSLVDKLLFAEWWGSGGSCGKVEARLAKFQQYLSTGDTSLLSGGATMSTNQRADLVDLASYWPYQLLKDGAAHIRLGEVARLNLDAQVYARYRQLHPSGSSALTLTEMQLVLTPLAVIPVPGLAIVDINNLWFLVFAVAVGLLILGRRKRSESA